MVSTATGSFAKLDSLENISGATFRIIGLKKLNFFCYRLDLPFYSNNYGVHSELAQYPHAVTV